MIYGFSPVYFPMSNKYLSAVRCRGAGAKYIPQSSSIEGLLAIKGKKDREETVVGGCNSSLVLLSGTKCWICVASQHGAFFSRT